MQIPTPTGITTPSNTITKALLDAVVMVGEGEDEGWSMYSSSCRILLARLGRSEKISMSRGSESAVHQEWREKG